MANNATPVNVGVNFNGVSYDPNSGTWAGTPTWNVSPDPVNIPASKAGDTMTIRWSLNAAATPRPFTAAFATNGILFGTSWTGGAPSPSNSTTISVADTFSGLAANQEFEYSIAVILSGTVNGQNVQQVFTKDPDVINETGLLRHVAV